jgi:phenylalanyl-tRNA synthetase alpha chain
MLEKLNEIEKRALQALDSARDEAALEQWRVANVGRSSPLMLVFAELGKLPAEERRAVGQRANQVKTGLEAALAERGEAVRAAAVARSLEEQQLDVTLPGRSVNMGRLHPSTQQLRRVLAILTEMGFQIYTSGWAMNTTSSCNTAVSPGVKCRSLRGRRGKPDSLRTHLARHPRHA